MDEHSSQSAFALTPGEEGELTPLQIIRSETVLSKLPIHNLSKKGKIDISIIKRNEQGEVELKWEVSYNERYGQARQLAYKLDTIIINRRIDEAGRPLPEMICLGSLNDLCEILGSNKNELKRALQQNATTSINAKLGYKASDGAEHRLEALFSRYSVIFTGEKLPDGRKADAVYIALNKPYLQVLNNAPVRPLNYDYLKALNPSAQRFYEIISYRVYAALKYKHPYARLPYSEYCTYSAQQRYFTYDQFKKQMHKVHLPHRKSGYLAKVEYEHATDAEGNIDWLMLYTPGPKAKAEYATFTKQPQLIDIKTKDLQPSRGEGQSAKAEQSVAPLPPAQQLSLTEMTRRGITETAARKLLADLAKDQPVLDQLELIDSLIAQGAKGAVRNPPGFYLYLLKENIPVPDNFETSRKRQQREEARAQAARAEVEQMEMELAYETYRREEIDHYIQTQLSETEYQGIIDTKRQELLKRYPNFGLGNNNVVAQTAQGTARSEIAKRITFRTFEAFCERERQQRTELSPERKD